MLHCITFKLINIEGMDISFNLRNSEPLHTPVLVDEEPKGPDTLCNLALYSLVKNEGKCDRLNINRSYGKMLIVLVLVNNVINRD